MTQGDSSSRQYRHMNLPNALTLGRIFLVPLLVVVLLTKFEGRLIFGVRKELRRRRDLRPRLADRLARRLPGAAAASRSPRSGS